MIFQTQDTGSSSCNEMVSSIRLKGTVSAIAFLRAPATAAQIAKVSGYDSYCNISIGPVVSIDFCYQLYWYKNKIYLPF